MVTAKELLDMKYERLENDRRPIHEYMYNIRHVALTTIPDDVLIDLTARTASRLE